MKRLLLFSCAAVILFAVWGCRRQSQVSSTISSTASSTVSSSSALVSGSTISSSADSASRSVAESSLSNSASRSSASSESSAESSALRTEETLIQRDSTGRAVRILRTSRDSAHMLLYGNSSSASDAVVYARRDLSENNYSKSRSDSESVATIDGETRSSEVSETSETAHDDSFLHRWWPFFLSLAIVLIGFCGAVYCEKTFLNSTKS